MKHLRILCLTTALVALAACQQFKSSSTSASQSSPAASSPTVATVDGKPISRDLYEFYIKGVTGQDFERSLTGAALPGTRQSDPRPADRP